MKELIKALNNKFFLWSVILIGVLSFALYSSYKNSRQQELTEQLTAQEQLLLLQIALRLPALQLSLATTI
jgi:ABC-type transport system involved in cytochrome c biogenesis permease subunit